MSRRSDCTGMPCGRSPRTFGVFIACWRFDRPDWPSRRRRSAPTPRHGWSVFSETFHRLRPPRRDPVAAWFPRDALIRPTPDSRFQIWDRRREDIPEMQPKSEGWGCEPDSIAPVSVSESLVAESVRGSRPINSRQSATSAIFIGRRRNTIDLDAADTGVPVAGGRRGRGGHGLILCRGRELPLLVDHLTLRRDRIVG